MDNGLWTELIRPGNAYRGMPFWAWNGRLEPEELRRQVRTMHEMGMGGFFMHSRIGLETPYLSEEWMDCIGACIDEAKKLGMKAWLYDEDRWPSGYAGGLVTKNPQFRARKLVLDTFEKAGDFSWTGDVAAAYTAKVDGNKASAVRRLKKGRAPTLPKGHSVLVFRVKVDDCSSWYNGFTYLDTMNHKAVKEFIRVTHDAYARRFGCEFGKTIQGIFTDEPNVKEYTRTRTPWTDALPKVFRKRYGYDILDHLPEALFEVDGKKVTPAARDMHDCTTFLFVDAYARQIGDWCRKHGLEHTGHVLSEETPYSQMKNCGSAMRFYEHMQAPGIDVLTQHMREYDTAKQVSSVARQFGWKWRLSETYGCTGWDFTFEAHKAVSDWQAALGINLRCQHLSFYTMAGEAKRDYPASIFFQSPWWRSYPKVEDYFARINVLMSRGREVRDILALHPLESMWAIPTRDDDARKMLNESHWQLRDTLLAANLDFDYGDEDILARHGRVIKKSGRPVLRVGKADYKAVVVSRMLTMRDSTLMLLERFRRAGGKVVFAFSAPEHVDAEPSPAAASLAEKCVAAGGSGKRLIA
ncbi:MAG TPA: glycosyl hydrolase, partial [Sedimentisphaerales bacterium]|nr:glycosyl hydrolase [Sedimentisphaerales bacterium]